MLVLRFLAFSAGFCGRSRARSWSLPPGGCSGLAVGRARLHEPDRVTLAHHALGEHGCVDPGLPAMRPRDMAQDARVRLPRVGIEGDHLASRVSLQDRNAQPLPEPQGASDQIVLAKRPIVAPVGVEIGPEPAPVQWPAQLLAEPPNCGVTEQGHRTAIVEAALGAAQWDGLAPLLLQF